MRVFIDTNVVLDFLLEREPFVEDAVKLFAKIDAGEIAGFIAATTITNIYYIIRKAAGVKVAEDAISQILSDLHICAVDKNVLEQAKSLNFKDFEDAVQYACAMISMVDVIVTRDVSGFVSSEIPQ
ncbi:MULTISPECIES: type II toxin-antitoxin system VapC family toxin [Cyanophyceae]|uniref:DNA-binding protein n=1 Tax=Nodularia spumigena CENA596 TaxID=1819295 RepID=A0A166JB75_NODSP|nr:MULTISPECIES: PIN domain-containing protein [Cyanophyceae]MDB9356937.1 PIN domain-containing protein [Nodularia spumigena CS-587/03]KZL49479.1 DNA-binding protein [Nodularia spumigena CENA596]MDB9341705.1 PIN domain-containing protein [Nodularia spumigena CS-589/07]MDB9400045.1 PIN domain-containing protein [Microcystis aeruginosa CS-567/02-A1]MDB9499329.1 PIN domain-containing protein [Nodularia spumigena CS-336/02]